MSTCQILTGDCRDVLKTLPDQSVNCCVTSPPYWGLRDYGHKDQIGLEPTPEAYVASLRGVFKEVWRVLRDDGTVWLNLGDSYAGSGKARGGGGNGPMSAKQVTNRGAYFTESPCEFVPSGCKPKDLVGIPWMTAFALRSDGWYLRSDIIWSKPNPMPESVTDRPTKSHEYLFLLSKSSSYYYDAQAIAEPLAWGSIDRLSQDVENQIGSDRVPGKTNGNMKAVARESWNGSGFDRGKTGEMKRTRGYTKPYTGQSTKDYENGHAQDASATKARIVDRILSGDIVTRNKRSVWTVSTQPFKEAHFATFPPDLIKPCILAGCQVGGTVLDPFGGSGTTGMVAMELGRKAILIELNEQYVKLAESRTNVTPGLPLA
jgi:DNA modification methylase